MWSWLEFMVDMLDPLLQIVADGWKPFYACFVLSLAGAALVFFVIPGHLSLRVLLSIGVLVIGCVSGAICQAASRRRKP